MVSYTRKVVVSQLEGVSSYSGCLVKAALYYYDIPGPTTNFISYIRNTKLAERAAISRKVATQLPKPTECYLDIYIIRITYPCVLYPITPHFYIEKMWFTGVYIIFSSSVSL